MGAKTWMLVLADTNAREALAAKPSLDRDATQKLAETLFPGETLEPIGDGDLSFTCPPDDELHIGCFPGVSIIAAKEFATEPTKLPKRFIAAGGTGFVALHTMISTIDAFAYGTWKHGVMERSLYVASEGGVMEDVGERLPFEAPYWSGKHPVSEDEEDDYPLPFHPLDLGEAALNNLFGYQLEGEIDPSLIEAEEIPLVRYKRSRPASSPWWKFW